MTTADAQRKAYHRLRVHMERCPKAQYQRFCDTCRGLDLDASADDWRRSEAREQVA